MYNTETFMAKVNNLLRMENFLGNVDAEMVPFQLYSRTESTKEVFTEVYERAYNLKKNLLKIAYNRRIVTAEWVDYSLVYISNFGKYDPRLKLDVSCIKDKELRRNTREYLDGFKKFN